MEDNNSGVAVSGGYAALDNVHLNYNWIGLNNFSTTDVRNSFADGNGGAGFASSKDLNLVHSVAVNNGMYGGIWASSGIVRVTDVLISHNWFPVLIQNGATIYSYGDNEVDGNWVNNSFPVTLGSKH